MSRDWRKRRDQTREIVRVERSERETLPQEYIDELARIKADLERFKDSQQFVMPKAFQEIVERVKRLEDVTAQLAQYATAPQPIDITPRVVEVPPDVAARLAEMEGMVASFSDFITTFNERNADSLAPVLKMLHGLMAEVSTNRARADAKYEDAVNHTNELARRVHAWTVGQAG